MRSVGTLCSIALALGCAALGACKGQETVTQQLPATSEVADKGPAPSAAPVPLTADHVFTTRCATCHGLHGRGDGPAAQALKPKPPRDYSTPAWQKSVTDAQIKKAIIEGGPAIGKSSLMGPNEDLADKPEVLDGLVAIIRGFSSEASAPSPKPAP